MSVPLSLLERLPSTRGRKATSGLSGFTYITLPGQQKLVRCLEAPWRCHMETSTGLRIASKGISYHLGKISLPADEDHEVLTRPLVCSRWPTKASFQRSWSAARRHNRQIRDTSRCVDSRQGKSTSVATSLQYSPTGLCNRSHAE
jgi:hypothetical protein